MSKMNLTAEQLKNMNRDKDGNFIPLPDKKAPAVKGRSLHKVVPIQKQDTNALTKACIDLLNLHGFKVWRNGNHAVYSVARKSYLKPTYGSLNGVPDIIGFNKADGTFIGVEIKVGKDKLSKEQKLFQKDCSGIVHYLVIKNIDELIKFVKPKK